MLLQFNVLSLDPNDATTFQPELLDVLSETAAKQMPSDRDAESERLRRQMQLDALQPMNSFDLTDETNEELQKPNSSTEADLSSLSEEKIEEAISFLRQNVSSPVGEEVMITRTSYRL